MKKSISAAQPKRFDATSIFGYGSLLTTYEFPSYVSALTLAKQALMTDQQLADRFEAVELRKWEDDAPFQQLLCSFGAILPLRKSSSLLDTNVRKRVLSLSEGVLVRICRLLESSAIAAIQTGAESIELGSIDDELGTQGLVSISDRRRRRFAS